MTITPTTIVVLILLAILVSLIVVLCSMLNLTLVTRAGTTDKFFWRFESCPESMPDEIESNGQVFSVAELGLYRRIIHGESIGDHDIHDNYRGFFHKFTKAEKENIQDMPIVEFKISENRFRFMESQLKLRKFIAYLPKQKKYDFKAIYEQYKPYITIDKGLFVKECEDRMYQLKWRPWYTTGTLVLSETYDCAKKRHHYSIHRATSLRGRLEYFYNPEETEEKEAA